VELLERDASSIGLAPCWGTIDGRDRLALIGAEAGVGKTSLVRRFEAVHRAAHGYLADRIVRVQPWPVSDG
jgi:hypothetical protein